MASLDDLRRAEASMRRLLREQDLPQPGVVEYREAEVVLLWPETKTAVVIDVEEGVKGAG